MTTSISDRRELQWYMAGHGLYFFAMGIQNVLFAWLLTVSLQETAERVGIALMLYNLPTLVFVLFGGTFADRHDCRRLLMLLQGLIALPPLVLSFLVVTEKLSYSAMCIYALVAGTLAAFLIPTRDSLLSRVSRGDVQRAVVIVMLVQFAAQFFGLFLAGEASRIGAAPIIAVQVAVMLLAIYTSYRLRPAPPEPRKERSHPLADILDGLAEVARSPKIGPVVLYMFITGIVTIGLYQVALPLLVRDIYQGSSAMLAYLNICFMVGVALVSLLLMRIGQIRRQGRVLMLAALGSVGVILILRLAPPEWVAYAALFVWGGAAGFSMSMSRSLVQSAAPPSHRARILATYQLGFMGGAPIGSFANGYLVKLFGLLDAMLIPAIVLLAIWLSTLVLSRLWYLEPTEASAGAR